MLVDRYETPDTVRAAVDLLAGANGDARAFAGGTDLLVQMKSGRTAPRVLVDLKHIPELRAIHTSADGFEIGAAVSGAEIGEHRDLATAWPGVVESAELIGSTQIQGRASLGGNVCNASPAADTTPALIAAGALCRVAGPNGDREVPVEEIVVAPGRTSLGRGELIVSFLLGPGGPRQGDAYLRFTPRTEMDIAVVGAGVGLTLDGSGHIKAARVGLGAVAPTPLRVDAAADAIVGGPLDDAALERLAAAARAACDAIDDKRGTAVYRTHITGVLAKRAAITAHERAQS